MSLIVKHLRGRLPLTNSGTLTRVKKELLFIVPLTGAIILLLLPAVFSAFTSKGPISYPYAFKEILLAAMFFLVPLFIFYRNIKVYFYLLLPLIILSPLFIFSIAFYDVRPRFELLALIMQSNYSEMSEAIAGYINLFFPVSILYILLYLYFIKKLTLRSLPFKTAFGISMLAGLFSFGRVYYEQELFKTSISMFSSDDLHTVKYYPVSLLGGSMLAYNTLTESQMKVDEHFSFHAYSKDTLEERKIVVFIIGESSRYDRWQLNGYERPTSPRLIKQKNLISFDNVVAGSNQTRMSVPQMITRATPDSIFLQYQEKSVLAAFREAGYKTAWLSNQTDQEVMWSGAINWHAKTADFSIFSPSVSPNFEFDATYDERLLPVLDSLVNTDSQNLFVVLHTMGSHWNYAKRYPQQFNFFTPSGKNEDICRPTASNKLAVSNSYDNSILYSDYIIDSVINTVKTQNAISSVVFLSDHGEDLYDAHPSLLDFHLNESPATLHVPLFIWTSDQFRHLFPEKLEALQKSKKKKIGTENTFYTLLDLANISIKKNNPAKSLASPYFKESEQKYLGKEIRKGFLYSKLIEIKE